MKRIVMGTAVALVLTGSAMAQNLAATANVLGLDANSLGTLTFTMMDGHVHISGELTGLLGGDHGIHIHEKGDCDPATKFDSAGGHFNPTPHQHGKNNPRGPHAGDLSNTSANAEGGGALVDLMNDNVTLGEGDSSLFDADGSSIVVHAEPDDYKTDPSGNSGDRIACGVIEAAPAQ